MFQVLQFTQYTIVYFWIKIVISIVSNYLSYSTIDVPPVVQVPPAGNIELLYPSKRLYSCQYFYTVPVFKSPTKH